MLEYADAESWFHGARAFLFDAHGNELFTLEGFAEEAPEALASVLETMQYDGPGKWFEKPQRQRCARGTRHPNRPPGDNADVELGHDPTEAPRWLVLPPANGGQPSVVGQRRIARRHRLLRGDPDE